MPRMRRNIGLLIVRRGKCPRGKGCCPRQTHVPPTRPGTPGKGRASSSRPVNHTCNENCNMTIAKCKLTFRRVRFSETQSPFVSTRTDTVDVGTIGASVKLLFPRPGPVLRGKGGPVGLHLRITHAMQIANCKMEGVRGGNREIASRAGIALFHFRQLLIQHRRGPRAFMERIQVELLIGRMNPIVRQPKANEQCVDAEQSLDQSHYWNAAAAAN
jgi:hypothetical protein